MAVSEKKLSSTEYQEPDSDCYFQVPKDQLAGYLALEASGLRLCAIDEQTATFEPCQNQEGVLRYPPVQVGVPRNKDFIDRYIKMGPSDQVRA